MAEITILNFGKQTRIRVDNMRDWTFEKFEQIFNEAFQKEYGTAPDFDLKKAWVQIQDELKKKYPVTPELKPARKGKHKK